MAVEKSGDAMVDFAVMWEPFGGAPPEDVFVKFGVPLAEYKRRLLTRLSSADRAELMDPALRARLIEYCVHATGTTRQSPYL
jgi:hypothetical protein